MNKRDLIKRLLEYKVNPSKDLVISEFCEGLCPQKKKYKEDFSWEKHCGCYAGEKSCQEAEDFYQLYISRLGN